MSSAMFGDIRSNIHGNQGTGGLFGGHLPECQNLRFLANQQCLQVKLSFNYNYNIVKFQN